jgi:hypothetical protein
MKKEVLIVLLAMFALPFASAEIFVSQPASLYNVGDEFNINVTVISSENMNNFFSAKLVCAQDNITGEAEIFKSPYSVKAGQQKVVNLAGTFDNFLIGTLDGKCFLKAVYGSQEASSKGFEITRKINVNIAIDKIILGPGEKFNVSLSAIREDSKPADGFAELNIPGLELTSYGKVTNGKFNYQFAIPDNAPAKSYELSAKVYERESSGKITNEGEAGSYVRVKQVAKKVDIAIDSQSVKPGDDIVYTLMLYDQAGDEDRDDASVVISSPNGEVYENKLVSAWIVDNFSTDSNSTPGYWKPWSQ